MRYIKAIIYSLVIFIGLYMLCYGVGCFACWKMFNLLDFFVNIPSYSIEGRIGLMLGIIIFWIACPMYIYDEID